MLCVVTSCGPNSLAGTTDQIMYDRRQSRREASQVTSRDAEISIMADCKSDHNDLRRRSTGDRR